MSISPQIVVKLDNSRMPVTIKEVEVAELSEILTNETASSVSLVDTLPIFDFDEFIYVMQPISLVYDHHLLDLKQALLDYYRKTLIDNAECTDAEAEALVSAVVS